MPCVGLGTYKLENAARVTTRALEKGYALIDTAFVYGGEKTEAEVAVGLRNSGKACFITTKHWRKHHGYDATQKCLQTSLTRLAVPAVDLYLMHWPGPGYNCMGRSAAVIAEKCVQHYFTKYDGKDWTPALRLETWRAMEDAYRAGLCRAIGVSNFTVAHLEHLLENCSITPHVNQVEIHPYNYDAELLAFCAAKGIAVTAYASLGGQDKRDVLREDATVVAIATKLKRSPAQVLLRWALQKGMAVIPKASNDARQHENAAIFDFRLAPQDEAALDALSADRRTRLTWCRDPLRDEGFF
jgi:diketogulonate reductase-like aldo/keto reductase